VSKNGAGHTLLSLTHRKTALASVEKNQIFHFFFLQATPDSPGQAGMPLLLWELQTVYRVCRSNRQIPIRSKRQTDKIHARDKHLGVLAVR